MKALVLINEEHTVLPDQERVIFEKCSSYERMDIPAKGWTLQEIEMQANYLVDVVTEAYHNTGECTILVFASPVSALIKLVMCWMDVISPEHYVFVLHNDHREKKELPNGKVIMTIASEGWQLV